MKPELPLNLDVKNVKLVVDYVMLKLKNVILVSMDIIYLMVFVEKKEITVLNIMMMELVKIVYMVIETFKDSVSTVL